MTSNPLARRRDDDEVQGEMQPGGTRTIHDGKSGRIWTVTRTNRPFAHDLCDAYNDGMSDEARRRGLRWFVNQAGEVKLGDDPNWTRHHTGEIERGHERERQEWMRNNQPRP